MSSEHEIVHFNPSIEYDEVDRRFDRLLEQLLEYSKNVCNLVEEVCLKEDDQLQLAIKIGDTDGRLLPRLVEKEIERRRILRLKNMQVSPVESESAPIKIIDLISERVMETIRVRDVIELMLESHTVQEIPTISIVKNRSENSILLNVMFSMYNGPQKGFTIFLPEDENENIGSLHIFDEYGLKRKIKSRIKIIDLNRYKEKDVYDPYLGERNSPRKREELEQL